MNHAYELFGNDELIILGSGGGRFMATSQQRATSGLVLRTMQNMVQIHIDPGPGAIRDVYTHHINPQNTTHLLLTHPHTDHWMSLPVLMEALHDDLGFHEKQGIFIAPKGYIGEGMLDHYYFDLMAENISMTPGMTRRIQPGFTITATKAVHGEIPNVGYILEFPAQTLGAHYRIAFTSDTAAFPEYAHVYRGVDVLVANILRPDGYKCRGHLCIDEFIPLLQEIKPKICIMIHFGAMMTDRQGKNQVPTQVAKVQAQVGLQTRVIGSEDGMRVVFKDHCPEL